MTSRIEYPLPRLGPRSTAFALCARLLGPDGSAVADTELWTELRRAIQDAGDVRADSHLDEGPSDLEADVLAGRWVRWFDLGRVAPYEGSNVPATSAGVTPRLADIAGFYAAFGVRAHQNRPDHVVAELEFMAYLLAAEADARASRRPVAAETAADAARIFLRDHLGAWIGLWSSRVDEIDELAPWVPVAAAATELVRAECHDRRVIPLTHAPVLVGDAGIAGPDDAALECGSDPASV
jgi:TorA maturation chaperone TorD